MQGSRIGLNSAAAPCCGTARQGPWNSCECVSGVLLAAALLLLLQFKFDGLLHEASQEEVFEVGGCSMVGAGLSCQDTAEQQSNSGCSLKSLLATCGMQPWLCLASFSCAADPHRLKSKRSPADVAYMCRTYKVATYPVPLAKNCVCPAAAAAVVQACASDMVQQALEGYNGCILCYGQTGRGGDSGLCP